MAIRRLSQAFLLVLTALPAVRAAVAQSVPGDAALSCDFLNSWTGCGLREQAKARNRIALVTVAGMRGVRLRTEPGDSGIAGSGRAERTDLALSPEATDCTEGREQWWAHSILFPDDYVVPTATAADPWPWGVVFNFHHTGPTGQANFQIISRPDGLAFWGAAGQSLVNGPNDPGHYEAPISPIARNVWYDFIYHVKWSSAGDGYFRAWVNGVQKLDHSGPTLYAGQRCYFKLANYHTPLGQAVSVVHARVLRGATREAVVPANPSLR